MSVKRKYHFNIILILTVVLFSSNLIFDELYIIKGTINNYNGVIYLSRAVDSKYYANDFETDSAYILKKIDVVNGKFEFELPKTMKWPLPFILGTEMLNTEHFLLEPANQEIFIGNLRHKVKPKIKYKSSNLNDEIDKLQQRLDLSYQKYDVEFKKLRTATYSKDSIIKNANEIRRKEMVERHEIVSVFTKEYPNSFVSFWNLVRANKAGYSKRIEDAYNNISPEIKKTRAAKIFENEMLISKQLASGSLFPKMLLKNTNLEAETLNVSKYKTKYVLIDFWFSYCKPCIAQFPELKEMYADNKESLEIISISTDRTKDISNWNRIMEKENLPWINYLDEVGKLAAPMGIKKFPTNFLLNQNGIIIQKDISLLELKMLLKKEK